MHPNPMVGAVVVKNGKILGSGAHEKFGGPHAEVRAFRRVKDASGATLYVTLEPCPHTGKTPPCVALILKKKIRRVVIAAKDPNPLVSGRGVAALKKNGVSVVTGVLEREARDLNKAYDYWMRKKVPYAILKFAQSLDGKIADFLGRSRWISGGASRVSSQSLRAASDAILVGINTVLADDPLLSVRSSDSGKQPLKVVLDSHLRTPLNARIFSKASPGRVVIATTVKHTHPQFKKFGSKAEILSLRSRKGRVDLESLFKVLGQRGIVNLLVEGGGEVTAQVLGQNLAREIHCYLAPIVLGGKSAPGSVGGEGLKLSDALKLRDVSVKKIGEDLLIRGKI